MTEEVWRLSGAGNDFLAVAGPDEDPDPERIRAWCRRGSSLGADGLFVLRPGDPIGMSYWNADGSAAALCLNGARCAAQLAYELGWAEGELRLATGAGVLRARRLDPRTIALDVPILPRKTRDLEVDPGNGRVLPGRALEVGVPHLVVPWAEGLASCPVTALGARLRADPRLGPEGANVHFVHWTGSDAFDVRSFERGVEAETLACGTGVLAAVAVGLERGALTLPATARTRGGFDLRVTGSVSATGGVLSWRLEGDARVLARVAVRPEAAALPAPRWV